MHADVVCKQQLPDENEMHRLSDGFFFFFALAVERL